MPQAGKAAFLARLESLNVTPRDFMGTIALWNKMSESDKLAIEAEASGTAADRVNYNRIKAFFNTTCSSYPAVFSMSDARKKAIKARFNAGYTYEDFERLFEAAENSSFLKGKNDRGWRATFDWLIKDSNMAKVLDGNYKDSATRARNSSYSLDDLNAMLNAGTL